MHSFDSTAPYLVRTCRFCNLAILAGNLIIFTGHSRIPLEWSVLHIHPHGVVIQLAPLVVCDTTARTHNTHTHTHTHTHPFSLSRGKFKRLAEIGESQNTLPQIATFLTPAVDLLTSLISLYMYSQLRNWWLTKTKWMVVTWRCVALSLM